jgi:hypothetical protein
MAKKTGFLLKAELFIEANAFDAEALGHARERIKALPAVIEKAGFTVVKIEDKAKHRVEIPEA